VSAYRCGISRFRRTLRAEKSDGGGGAKQRRWRHVVPRGVATGGQEGEHVPLLLACGVGDGHQVFGEGVAALALGAERAFAPKNERANLSLSVVICRLDAGLVEEGPQGLSVLEDVSARPKQARDIGQGGVRQDRFELLSHRGEPGHERGVGRACPVL
jgi:hypothetical protein